MKRLAFLATLAFAASASAHPLDGGALPELSQYFTLGVEHIWGGLDHLLFVLGLVIATRSLRALVLTISAFTVAHSITLGLGLLDVVTPNSAVIEVLIALSIAYVGYENMRVRGEGRSEPPKQRVLIVLGFGLAHGFGFAGAIHDVGLPLERELAALALFNLGVEAGQLAVLLGLWPVLVVLRRMPRWEPRAALLVNALLIAAGGYWTLERSVAAPEREQAQVLDTPSKASGAALSAMAPSAHAPSRTPAQLSPWITPLCEALHALPRERRAACSGDKPGILLTSACERALAASVESNALQIDAAQAERCIAEQSARYEGCEWTEARVMPQLPACQAVLQGVHAEGARCASSLECGGGLFCRGASAFDAGTCTRPLPAGARCELAADPLGSYLPSPPDAHRECENRCTRGRCG